MIQIITSIRIVVVSMFLCCVCYTLLILGIGQLFTPYTANGWLITDENHHLSGSEQIAQAFSRDEYFWPRPSAVGYNGTGSGATNYSPTNPILADSAMELISRYGGSVNNPVPGDLVSASGSGLDPHITLKSALFQAKRVAKVRNLNIETVKDLLKKNVFLPGGRFSNEPLINVLLINRALDGFSLMKKSASGTSAKFSSKIQ